MDTSRNGTLSVRAAVVDDVPGILALYRRVAAVPGGLARLEHEVSEAYVADFVGKSLANGIVQVAESPSHPARIVGEIHAYSPGLYCFSHLLSDLTIAVDPEAQGGGVGRRLFESLLDRVVDERPEIVRVELIARASNCKALRFYESLGFVREGRLVGRIRNVDGSFESDIPMFWARREAGTAIQPPMASMRRS